jgi:putative transcriptional regulator
MTEAKKSHGSLKGHVLIAMPQMADPRFHRSVIFVCVHDKNGAMGMVVNAPLPMLDFPDLLKQVGILTDSHLNPTLLSLPVMTGGPVEAARGFLLHTGDFRTKDTITVDDQFFVSGTIDSLRALTQQSPLPKHMLFCLGYAGWTAGQIEKELQDNAWMIAPASHELIFKTPSEQMWEKAFATIGVNPARLSSHMGHA